MKKKIIGMAARFVEDKNQQTIINIVRKYENYFKKNNCIFMLAGFGPTEKKLKNLVKKLKLEKKIIFSGNLNENDLIKWYKKLYIYIHLSKDETSSTSILQAMSIGLPIIASDIGGNKMLLKTQGKLKNLILIKNDNNEKIIYIIDKFIKNKFLKKKISSYARHCAIKYFSNKQMSENYEKIISQKL